MITIIPENPSSDDYVTIDFISPRCAIRGVSYEADGSSFIINVDPEIVPCISAPPPPTVYSWPVGRLETSEYQVIVNDVHTESETMAFSVSQGELPFPTPPIPSLGFAGAILLAAALAWIANKAFKRTPNGAA